MWSARCASKSLHALEAFELPGEFRVAGLHASCAADTSERVRHALQQLHAEHHFSEIEFPVEGGVGLRAIQAKLAGLAFEDVTLVVRLDSCGAWQRERELRWPSGYEEVEADFAERFAFENADVRLTPDAELLAFVKKLEWDEPLPPTPSPKGRGGAGESPSLTPRVQPRLQPQTRRGTRGERGGAASEASGVGSQTVSSQPLVTIGIAHYNLGQHLPETLASLAAQTYRNLEVIVIDDGSTDAHSLATFAEMEARYPGYRFHRQANIGIGATRNRCLELARGEFFIPVDADNIARPEMVERFVRAITRNPHLAAMSCYFLAFEDGAGNPPARFLHACRPLGGPHVLAGIRNVYGDANAIFRTGTFCAIGGYATDRGTSCEDWEAFVKLVHAGQRIGVVPEHLFYYRHLATGFSRRTNWYANHQRVLRNFTGTDGMSAREVAELWSALLGFHQQLEQMKSAPRPRRHRVADAVHALVTSIPRGLRRVFGKSGVPS